MGLKLSSQRPMQAQEFYRQEELPELIHEAISQKKMGLLRFLTSQCNASLEERNQQGMTPLYHAVCCNWPDGALELLELGADVHNAESAPQTSHRPHRPLIHLAVKTGSKKLLRKLIERGADIRARDFRGWDCVDLHRFPNLWECLADAVTEHQNSRSDLEKDLLFIVHAAAVLEVSHEKVDSFITRQQSCLHGKIFQLFAACLWLRCHWTSSFEYWRKAAACQPDQVDSSTEEEEAAPLSAFADIFNERIGPSPGTLSLFQDTAMHFHALCAVELLMPEDDLLTDASRLIANSFRREGQMVTAIGVLWRLTTVRMLCENEIFHIVDMLIWVMEGFLSATEIPVDALLDAMNTIKKCLFDHTEDNPEPWTSGNMKGLLQAFSLIVIAFHDENTSATLEEQETFLDHMKDFLESFPWTQDMTFLHFLAFEEFQLSNNASVVKTLVACSAEARGTIRQENFPPHLSSDERGNTPLHGLALSGGRKLLVEEGVLQCFLDHGAHLCTRNDHGESVRSILADQGVCSESELFPSLQCLAASAFMRDDRLRQTVENCCPLKVQQFLLDH